MQLRPNLHKIKCHSSAPNISFNINFFFTLVFFFALIILFPLKMSFSWKCKFIKKLSVIILTALPVIDKTAFSRNGSCHILKENNLTTRESTHAKDKRVVGTSTIQLALVFLSKLPLRNNVYFAVVTKSWIFFLLLLWTVVLLPSLSYFWKKSSSH